MTNENNNLEIKTECFCKSKWFKKILSSALGTFIGVFCALSLFAALHKPPVMHCPFVYGPKMHPPVMHCKHHFKHQYRHDKDFRYKKMKNNTIAPDRVKVEVKG